MVESVHDDERAIRDLIDIWMAASRDGDLETVLSLMTDDVVFMVPGREPFGKNEFASASRSMKGARVDGRSDIRELRVLGEWAYLRNYLQVTMTPPGVVSRCGVRVTRSLFCGKLQMVAGSWPAMRI